MEQRKLIKTTNRNTILDSVVNWDKNRPPDMCRVEEIQKDMSVRGAKWVDGVILLWKQKNNTYVCYDGIHRLEACRTYKKEVEMIIQVRWNCPESVIMEEFLRINKSVPVSSLYSLAEEELSMKNTIESVVKYYQGAYPEFFKPSAKPRVPHQNRDRMMESLFEMTRANPKRKAYTMRDWLGELELIEQRIINDPSIVLTPKQKEKCDAYNFWLFATSRWSTM